MDEATQGDVLEWLVTELLAIRPERVEAELERLRAEHGETDLRAHLFERHRVRAALSGVVSGARASGLVPSLLEHRSALRRRALVQACMLREADPRLFEDQAWPRRVLGLGDASPLRDLAARELTRFAVRFAVVRGARAALSVLPGPLAGLGGGAIGALFDAVEHELARRGATRAAPVRPDAAIEILRAAARGPRLEAAPS
ncbi:MAG: hypothetical protein VYE22_26570 [Myxococcota bacterium]|nr:hypothetical protein [Myxococcota bacterium]